MSWAENHSYLGRQFRLPSAQSSSAGLFLGVTTINDGASKNPSFKSSFLSPLFLLLGLHSAGVHPWKGGEDCGDVCGCFWVTASPADSPAWIFSCCFKLSRRANFLSHSEQLNGSLPACVFLCCFKSPKCLNFLSHCKQVKCSSSVWILSCCVKSPLSANFLSHCEQLNGSSPVWILSCSFKSLGSANFLSHCEQLNGSSQKGPWRGKWLLLLLPKIVLG